MKRLRSSDHRVMPWRNGGGTTTELVVDPGERFRFRASIADVPASGPFSRFDGYERHIMIVEGQGMTLACGVHGDIELEPFVPRTFSGDWEVHGTLRAGPVRDFNWIVDRSMRSLLEVRLLDAPTRLHVAPGSTCVIHVFSGALREASAGETLVASSEDVHLTPNEQTRVAVAWAHRRVTSA